MKEYWMALVSFICLGIVSTMLIRSMSDIIDQKEAEIQQLIQEREILRGFYSECIIDNMHEIRLQDLMNAWTPMTAAEISYWREKEENRG